MTVVAGGAGNGPLELEKGRAEAPLLAVDYAEADGWLTTSCASAPLMEFCSTASRSNARGDE